MDYLQKANDYLDRVYAGWLGKLIGVRLGAPIEGWSYDKIRETYGEVTDYLVDYKEFAADDDSNGPMFFLRALDDYTHTRELTPEQIGLTWLNYAPFEHGFYWWGGYGKSTEHTAYLNLRNGIMAPRSGSVEQNGAAVAEQIGGQIFIDTWGLVVPGNPELAAEYAMKAASVSHGGNGVYGGMFIAACISAAFVEKDMEKIIAAGLRVIPGDCEYTRMTRAVQEFYHQHPEDWRLGFQFVHDNFGYDRYPGACHIIPNAAVIVLSLLYGEGDFSRTICICNMCGWDTDCNVGNIGAIVGVRNGLEGIDYRKWREPIHDLLICSSVIGTLNILDVPWCATYIARLAYKIAGVEPPEKWREILAGTAPRFHFEWPGSTHSIHASHGRLEQSSAEAHNGGGSLKVTAGTENDSLKVYYKTYYRPKDFHDSRYDPGFSPLLYPGQTMRGWVKVPDTDGVSACLYVRDGNSGRDIVSELTSLPAGEWVELCWKIPALEGACLEEAGVVFTPVAPGQVVFLDDFDFQGEPDYTIDFQKERMDIWYVLHQEVSQFTFLKGIWQIENGMLSGSSCDFGEAYTGGYHWKDYRFEGTIIPQLGEYHNLNFRVQGGIRSYAVGLAPGGKLVLYKNVNGYRTLKETNYPWTPGQEYRLNVELTGGRIRVSDGSGLLLDYTDTDQPYLTGQIGVSVFHGSHCHYKDFSIGTVK